MSFMQINPSSFRFIYFHLYFFHEQFISFFNDLKINFTFRSLTKFPFNLTPPPVVFLHNSKGIGLRLLLNTQSPPFWPKTGFLY